MPTLVVPPRRTVPRPASRDRRDVQRAPTPLSPSPAREASPTFSILDGYEANGSFSGATPSCVKLARLNTQFVDWNRLRQIIAPHRNRTHLRPSRGTRSNDVQANSVARPSESSDLFELLAQPYVEPLPPPSPKPWIRPSNPSFPPGNWSARSLPEDDEGEDELPDPDTDLPPQQIHYEITYTPHGKYAWAVGQPASKLRLLAHLDTARPKCGKWNTDLMFALVGGRPTTFMCKSWSRSEPNTRFLPEFKLMSSGSYLRPLQGVVVPYVINLYNTRDAIQLFMEVPHPSFWVEASPSMSDALKQRVVDAYRRLHEAGVLHGAVEKKNILISGDGRVTIVDFSMSRTMRPIEEIGLERCSESELALELRKVMYILDYGNAQAREMLAKDNGDRRGPKSEAWEEWKREFGRRPRRWLVPGQTQEQYASAVSAFRTAVVRLEKRRAVEVVSPLLVVSPECPLPVRNRLSYASPLGSRRKRKAPTLDTHGQSVSVKRPRVGGDPPEQPLLSGTRWEYTTTSYSSGSSDLPAASDLSSAPPPVKVRDFASEPYTGTRGYYVPHPPTELIMSSYRAADIRNANAIRCGGLGLPYWRGDENENGLMPPSYIRPLPKGKPVVISLGALKRQWDETERVEITPSKKMRLDHPQPLSFTEDWEVFLEKDKRVRFDDRVLSCDPWTYEDVAGSVGGLGDGKDGDFARGRRLTAPLSYPRHRGIPTPSRTILKASSPRRTATWDLRAWPHPADEEILTTPLMEQCGVIWLPPPRTPAPEAATSAHRPDSSTIARGPLPSPQASAEAAVNQVVDVRRPSTPITGSVPSERKTQRHQRTASVQLTATEVEDFEASQVEEMLEPGWDPALTPQENLFAIADTESITPYRMDTDVCRWLRRGTTLP